MGYGTCWGYFEISGADVQYLLDASAYLPDASELGPDSGARFDIEKYLQRMDESIAWWKPLTLQTRQYTQKVIGSENVTGFLNLMMRPVIDICVGEIRNDLMGVYLVYNSRWSCMLLGVFSAITYIIQKGKSYGIVAAKDVSSCINRSASDLPSGAN